MHAARIDTEETKPGRVYALLKGRPGEWWDHYELQLASETSSVSTHLSNVRLKLPVGEVVETEQRKRANGKRGWFSRWVLAEGQVAA